MLLVLVILIGEEEGLDLRCGDLPLVVFQRQNLVSVRLDRTGLMDIDVAAAITP